MLDLSRSTRYALSILWRQCLGALRHSAPYTVQHFAHASGLYASLAFMHLGLVRFSAYIATQRFALFNGLYASLAFMHLRLARFSASSCISTLRAFQWLVCIACLYAFGTCALFCIHCDSTLRAFQRLERIAGLYAFGTCALFCIQLHLNASRFPVACTYRLPVRTYGCLVHRASPSRRAAKILAARAPVNRRTACRHARPGR